MIKAIFFDLFFTLIGPVSDGLSFLFSKMSALFLFGGRRLLNNIVFLSGDKHETVC